MRAREVITNKLERGERETEVLAPEPPTSRPLLLTRSQEATFESVEKLQRQLEGLVEGGQQDEIDGKNSETENAAAAVDGAGAEKAASPGPVRCKSMISDVM